MRAAKILLSWLVGGLIIGFLIWYLPPKLCPQYTAQTFIRVLPASERGLPPGPRIQSLKLPGSYSASVVALIKHQSTLESLVDKDTVQKTGWFQHFGKTKDERMAGAVAELKKRFRAGALPDSDLVAVSLTCRDGKEGATVLNEMVDMFLKLQQTAKKKQIAADLGFLEEQRVRIQRDLDSAERELDNVHRRYGFTDLEQHDYPHPITARLIRLQSEEDDCALEIEQLQTHRDELLSQPQVLHSGKAEPNSTAEMRDVQFRLKLLQGRFAELKKMCEETEKKQEELDLAKIQYAMRQAIRDNRRRALELIKSRIEELRILHDDPDASGVQFVDSATDPRQADMWPWQTIIPTVVAAAAIAGIVHLLLTKRASKMSP